MVSIYFTVFIVLLFANWMVISYLISVAKGKNQEHYEYKLKLLEIEQKTQLLSKVFFKPLDIKFETALSELQPKDKNYYDEMVKYMQSLKEVELKQRKYFQSAMYKESHKIAQISISNNKVIVKYNFGNVVLHEDFQPVLLKPIKVVLRDDTSLEEAKRQFLLSYYKVSGSFSNQTVEEAK